MHSNFSFHKDCEFYQHGYQWLANTIVMLISINVIITVWLLLLLLMLLHFFNSHFIGSLQYDLDVASKIRVREIS